MSIAGKYLSKVNDVANPEWATFEDVQEAFMKGRTVMIVEGNMTRLVLGIDTDHTVETSGSSFMVMGAPSAT